MNVSRLWAGGAGTVAPSIFDRVFDGPVVPEATPHPRKVKFTTGGTAAPGSLVPAPRSRQTGRSPG